MTKHLRILFVMLLAMIWSAGWAQKVTLDFSKSTNPWKLPTSYSKVEKSYSYNGYTISFKYGTEGDGYIFTSYSKQYFLQMGKTGMTLVLPTFDFEVSKIVVEGHFSGNEKVTQNIFVAETPICTETKGTKGTNTYIIPDTYQTKGTVYKLKVTNKNVTKITSIKIYEKETTSTKTSTTLTLGDYANKTFSFTNGKPDDTFTTPTATVTPEAATGAVQYTSSNKDIVTVATNGELSFTNTTFGSATISAQFIATGDYANSNTVTYTVVNKEPQKTATEVTFGDKSQQTITLTEGDVTGVVFPKASEKNNIAGTVSYESSNTDVAVVDVDGNVTIKGAYGEATITATFTPADAETYAVSTDWYKVVNKVNAAFYESFDKYTDVEGGNDGKFNSGSGTISDEKNDVAGWTFLNGYAAKQCVRLGTQKNVGSATTPSITITGIGVLSFKAAAWKNDAEATNITVSVSEGSMLKYNGKTASSITVDINRGAWTDIDNIEISGAKTFTITFAGNNDVKNRFFLDEVMVKNVAESGETTAITLDEKSESNTIEAKTGVNVTLKRTMVANEWNTICLPFDVSKEQAQTAFGEGVKIAQLDDKNSTGNTLKFVNMTDCGMEATVPYLIKPSKENTSNEYVFENVNVVADDINKKYETTEGYLVFKGIYNMMDIKKDVVDNVDATYYAAFLGAGDKIYKAGTGMTKGFRAYFAIPKDAAASALSVVIDGTATSIKNIDSEVVESNAPVYNLQGQRVNGNNLTPGIYVKAGKKFVVK